MLNRLLTTFDRSVTKNSADFGEKIGNIGLGLLRIGFGKTVIVARISGDPVFAEKVYPTSARVGAIALFIFAFPLTIPIAGIGCVGTVFSKSHEQMFNSTNFQFLLQIDPPKHNPSKHVQFGNARVRFFNKASPASEVGNLQSTEFKLSSEGEDNTILQTRKIPPTGVCDTIIWSRSGPKSVHESILIKFVAT